MTSPETAVNEIQTVVEEIKGIGKMPVMIGGEHTITLGTLRALKPQTVIVFDAHLDLRDELFEERLCHATYLRRAHEEIGFKLVIVAARAFLSTPIFSASSSIVLAWVILEALLLRSF